MTAGTKSYVNGNHEPVEGVVLPVDPDTDRFIYDVDGNEVRKGDFVHVIESHWPDFNDKIAEVTQVNRGNLYAGGWQADVWAPGNPLNTVQAEAVVTRSSTGIRYDKIRKVNLTDRKKIELKIDKLRHQRAGVLRSKSSAELRLVEIDREIIELRAELGDDPVELLRLAVESGQLRGTEIGERINRFFS